MTTAPAAVPSFGGAVALTDPPRRAFVEQVMGLPVSVHVRGPRARGAEVAAAVEALFTALRRDDALFSPYRPGSQVSRIRRGDLHLRDADPRVRLVAALGEEAAERTDGWFSVWLPGPDGARAFDPTGLVKGWAVQEAFTALTRDLARLGRYDALVNAGGDVAMSCTRVDTADWRIAVEDPRDRSRILLTVPMRTGAVATSGVAARGAHLVDPTTGRRATDLLSATVIGPDLTWADVYATAAFVRGPAARAWLAGLPDHTGLLVSPEGPISG